MRRLFTFLAMTVITAVAALHWLHDGDLAAAVEPVLAEWDAELLARNAGLAEAPAAGDPPAGAEGADEVHDAPAP